MALMVIDKPCTATVFLPKKTMNFGPKTMVGNKPNRLMHQYTATKGMKVLDFDTISKVKAHQQKQFLIKPNYSQRPTTSNPSQSH